MISMHGPSKRSNVSTSITTRAKYEIKRKKKFINKLSLIKVNSFSVNYIIISDDDNGSGFL